MEENQPQETAPSRYSKEQKIGFALLLVFALLSVGLGLVQIRNTMYAPFALNNKVPATLRDEVNTVDALRFRDTDFDTLKDFDELYVYNTSPYLADTDSDGIKDDQEIGRGTNPLCAEGKDCATIAVAGGAVPSAGVASGTIYVPPPPPLDPGTPTDLVKALQDPQEVRKLLLGSGIDKSTLDKVSDQDLIKMVNELLNSTSTQATLQSINNLYAVPSGR